MTVAFPKLFEPTVIGKIRLKNRIAMAPMGILGLTDPDGNPGQRAIDYYIERARGGVGLIITGLFKVENKIEGNIGNMHLINFSSVGPFGELSEAIHALGARIIVQLTAGFGRVSAPYILSNQPVSASAIPNYYDPRIICRPLETGEVEKIVESFGLAAKILAASGVDGVELHGHEGYLFDQFTTAIWNRRMDKYGGDLRSRITFPVEVLQEIKNQAGSNFVVVYRFGLKHYMKDLWSGALSGEHYTEAGRNIQEGLEMAGLLEKAGFDALHVDAGCYDSWYWAHPPTYQQHGCMVDMAARAKEAVKIPVIAVGKLDIPEQAEKIMEDGKADIIALGRGLLADAYWPVKAAEGKVRNIRPCIGCHDGCLGRLVRGKPLSCAVNPACGRERLYELGRAKEKRKIAVVGGGGAGMEAARVAATRGHQVILYEKNQFLGGHLIEASIPEFKKDLKRLLQWYENQLGELDIELKLNTEVTGALLNREKPETVIVATGSVPLIPDIPGIDKASVATCIDLLVGKKQAGNTAVVMGGGLVGCETALWLAENHRKVTIVEILPELMTGGIPVPHMNRQMLLDLLALNRVEIIRGTSVQEITGESIITIDKSSNRKLIKTDTVVLASGLKPDNGLYQSLIGKFPHLYALGDCRQPRNIMGAIWDGYEVGRAV